MNSYKSLYGNTLSPETLFSFEGLIDLFLLSTGRKVARTWVIYCEIRGVGGFTAPQHHIVGNHFLVACINLEALYMLMKNMMMSSGYIISCNKEEKTD